jgi:hypothetical protein
MTGVAAAVLVRPHAGLQPQLALAFAVGYRSANFRVYSIACQTGLLTTVFDSKVRIESRTKHATRRVNSITEAP